MSTPPKSPSMGYVGLPSQPPKVPTKKEKLTASGSAERSQGGLEVVGSDRRKLLHWRSGPFLFHGLTARPLRDPWYQMKGLFPAMPPATSMTVFSMYWVSSEFFRYRYNFSIQAVLLELGPIGLMKNWWITNLLRILQEAGVFEAIVISQGLNIYRNVAGTRHLVKRWCPCHTYFLFGLGIRLTAAEFVIEEELIESFGGKGASFGRHLAKYSTWVTTFRRRSNEFEKYIRHAAFVAFWLTKFVFCEHPYYAIQPLVFRLAIKISFGNYFPLAPMFLGHLYTHLDLLHANELAGASYRVVASVINMSLLQACLWEHLKEYRRISHYLQVVRGKKVGGFDGLVGIKGQGLLGAFTPICMLPQVLYPGPSRVGACTKHMHDYWARVMGIFVEYVRGGTPSDIPMHGLRVEPPSNFRILCNVAFGNGYGSRQGAGYVEWHEEKSSWKVFETHLPPEWASTHSTFIEDEGGRSKKGKRVAEKSPVAPIDPSKEGKKKAKVHVDPATSFPITSVDVLATSKPVSPSIVVTIRSARRTRNQSKLVTVPVEKDEKDSKDLPIDISAGDKSPNGGKETSAKAVKAFAGDVDAAVDVGNTLTEEGVHVNATTGEFSTFNESNINICEPEGLTDPARGGLIVKGGTAGIDLDIDLAGDDGVETVGAQTELAPGWSGVPPHASLATHDSLGIEFLPMIESTKVVEPTTIADSYVGLLMIWDKLITHATPTSERVIDPNNLALISYGGTPATVSGDGTSSNDSEGLRDGMLDQDAQEPYDDMDDNLVVRKVSAPFSGEVVDTSSSSGEGIEVSPARGDDLDLTLRVPYSRLHGELSTFFDGSMRTMAREGSSANLLLAAGRVGLSEGSTISTAKGLTQFLEDLTKEIYNDHSPRHFWFGYGSGSFYLRLLSDVLCDMRRTPLELVSERKLQDWRGVARELIDLGFAVDFAFGEDP
uniref:Aminotransferase-like plant mobile domain-containing protein n=1 Tax=Fagus sylvatica TaxID=28930 RepID=A0A2N9EE56_FAGSY